jgi:hypothetical protein
MNFLFETPSYFLFLATIPSVVCMTIINPLVFQTIDVKLCSHLILVPTVTDTDIFQSTLSSDTRSYLFFLFIFLIDFFVSSTTIKSHEDNQFEITNLLFHSWPMETSTFEFNW